MNNKGLLLLTSLCSFGLGVSATALYFKTENPPLVEETIIHDQAPEKERKPFFVDSKKETSSESAKEESAPIILPAKTAADLMSERVRAKGVDYFKLAHQVKNFQNKLTKEIRGRFEEIRLNDQQHRLKRNFLSDKYDYLNIQKKPWFKASIDLGVDEKINLFFNYYPCQMEKKRFNVRDPYQVCFVMWAFVFYKQNWEQYSISSNSELFLWKDEAPYVTADVENLGNFSSNTSILKIMFPVPDLDEPFHILKYTENVFSWSEGHRLRWTPISEQAARKFQDDVNQYNTTHRSPPER